MRTLDGSMEEPITDTAFEGLSETQRRLLGEFGRRSVRFIVIGGYAMRFYGRLRPAHDLDLVVDCRADNLHWIKECLDTLGARRTEQVVPRLRSGVKQIVKWNDTELWSSNFDRSYDSLARERTRFARRSPRRSAYWAASDQGKARTHSGHPKGIRERNPR